MGASQVDSAIVLYFTGVRQVGRDPATLRRSIDIIVTPKNVTDIGIPGF